MPGLYDDSLKKLKDVCYAERYITKHESLSENSERGTRRGIRARFGARLRARPSGDPTARTTKATANAPKHHYKPLSSIASDGKETYRRRSRYGDHVTPASQYDNSANYRASQTITPQRKWT